MEGLLPVIKEIYNTQVGSGATVANALQGTILERAPSHGILRVFGVEEATAAGAVEHTLFIGTDRRVNKARGRRTDDLVTDKERDLIYVGKIVQGQLILAQLQEVSAAAMDLYVEYEFEEVPDIRQLMAMQVR